ncbi:LOW QUALITY PROTEIN: T-cell activation Rho GTPase-activating protein-like [Mastomys coucha]|uniref:LOW QUALITY PROTEIN: T-cell activation Rho GTPase-activating protein-like n=1 Tax=Mastomys coucha TaxID=35658 RepID=UPI0012625970|nr:LOW QUALITY PROTEIN: T-cell activation Rho GTPase-activating protein-like [Mastomys coucha]
MSNLQDTSGPWGSEICTDVPNLPGPCGRHLNPDAQEPFIPKPRDQPKSQQHSDAEKESVNKRWPFISRVFHRASVLHQDQVCTSLPVTKRGKLFGYDLTVVCDAGNLPKAVLDMLSLLNEKGPITEGIFRISANISACQALKEKLDSGKKVDLLNKECVLVVASVLKEFLHNIQGSVLTSRLYELWLGVLDQGDEEEKLAAVQSLLEHLPNPNVILLRELFRMLHNIEQNSAVNQMTAYSLSVCMAPCILCLPSSCNFGLASDISNEISLVKFLIENTLKIFGEDMVLCYDVSSVSCPSVEKASSSLNFITYFGEMKDKHCRTGRTSSTGNDSVPMSPAAPLHNEWTIDYEKPVNRPFMKPMITCGSPTSHDNVCITPSPSAPSKGRLFGKSVTSICKNGILPSSILDMLSIIDEKGPHAENIFRTLANKSYFTLKEKLNCAEEMNLREESVYVIASVLKEFIRTIPGSLLCSNLYGKWLAVLDQELHDQKISAIQSLLIQMPEPSVLLLRHLLSVLHKIKGCSCINHMTAYALSVRIAPSMLWHPTSSSSGIGNDISKKISLVEIFIENFLEIFGEDATVFYGEIPRSCSDTEKVLGSSNNVAESNETRKARGDSRGSCHSEKMHPQKNDEKSLSASS